MTLREYVADNREIVEEEQWQELLLQSPTACRLSLQQLLLECGVTREDLGDTYVDISSYKSWLNYCLQSAKEHLEDEEYYTFDISKKGDVRITAPEDGAFGGIYTWYSKHSIDRYFMPLYADNELDIEDFTTPFQDESINVDAQLEFPSGKYKTVSKMDEANMKLERWNEYFNFK